MNLNSLISFPFELPFEFKVHGIEVFLAKINYELFIAILINPHSNIGIPSLLEEQFPADPHQTVVILIFFIASRMQHESIF